MKRLLIFILIWSFLVLTGTVLSADGQTRAGSRTTGARTTFEKIIEQQWRQTDVIR